MPRIEPGKQPVEKVRRGKNRMAEAARTCAVRIMAELLLESSHGASERCFVAPVAASNPLRALHEPTSRLGRFLFLGKGKVCLAATVVLLWEFINYIGTV